MSTAASTSSLNSTIVRSIFRTVATGASQVAGYLAPDTVGRLAARVFTTPVRSADPVAPALPLTAAGRRDWMVVDGVRHARWTWGDPAREPTVFLVHGWGGRAAHLNGFVRPLLEAGRAVVAFDHAAHGESEGRRASLPRFARAIHAATAGAAAVDGIVGHSLGAAAIALALHQGVRASRVALLAPPANLAREARRFSRARGIPVPAHLRMLAWLRVSEGIEVEQLKAREFVPGLATPALVVHDLADRTVPWGDGEEYALRWPGARMLTTVGLGHWRLLRDKAVIAAVLGWIEGAEVGRRIIGSPALASLV
jgi:hypothetical protein